MDRRHFMALAAGLTVLPALPSRAETLAYTPGLVDQHLANGETVFVDFYTTWCSTCRAQGRAVDEIRAADPAFDQAMTFIKVDWDRFSDSDLAQRLNIPRRSTLVVLRGDEELGRIVAGTSRRDIETLMRLGLPG